MFIVAECQSEKKPTIITAENAYSANKKKLLKKK